MGYSTEFEGELKFTSELTVSQLLRLNCFFNEDCRDHKDWLGSDGLYYVDLELIDDFSGLKWNGAEKTYEMVKIVNMVILNMREIWPEFGLKGAMLAQGDDVEDKWRLVIGDDGMAVAEDVPLSGVNVECPHCLGRFEYEG